MNRIQSAARLILICVALIPAMSSIAQQSNTEKFVLALHETKFRWMVELKLDSLATVLDDRLVYIHSSGWTQTRKDMLDDLKSGKLVMNKVTVNESTARYYKDNTVIITAKGVFNVMIDNKPVDVNLYYTEVYIKKKNSWLLASRHASKL